MPKSKVRPDGTPAAGLPKKENAAKDTLDTSPPDESTEFQVEEEDDKGFPTVSPGIHSAKVSNLEQGESQNGNSQYVWDFVVTAGEDKGKVIRYWTSLVPQARWKVTETLRALGLKSEGSVFKFNREQLIGKPCRLLVKFDQDRATHKVDKVLSPTAEAIQAASEVPIV